MIYKKYGKTFRILRTQKNLSLSNFSSIALSKSTISKFERGETMMGFDKVLSSLQIIGVSLEEFEFLLNGSTLDDSKFLMQEIEKAIIEQSIEKLQKLNKIAKNVGLDFIALTAKSGYSSLNEEEVEKVTDYFFSIELWLVSDLWILSFMIEQLDVHDSLHILDQLIADKENLTRSALYSHYLVKVICNGAIHLIKLGYKDYAIHLLSQIRNCSMIQTSTHNFMFLKNLYNLTFGYWTFSFQNSSSGKYDIEKSLRVFKEVGTPELYKYYKNIIQTLLKSNHIKISTNEVSL